MKRPTAIALVHVERALQQLTKCRTHTTFGGPTDTLVKEAVNNLHLAWDTLDPEREFYDPAKNKWKAK